MQSTAQVPLVRLVPTIKGIFVNSHVEAVRRQLGPGGVIELERRFGAPLSFRANQDVRIADEIRLIEIALDLTSHESFEEHERAREAGRLHFRNFATTSYARVLFTLFPRNFRFMVLHARTVAERVFKGIQFRVDDRGPTHIDLTMVNADYPIEHFQGLFEAWMEHFGLRGTVGAARGGHNEYHYSMEWSS